MLVAACAVEYAEPHAPKPAGLQITANRQPPTLNRHRRPNAIQPPIKGVAQSGRSFGYSSCLKWGYANSIDVAAFNVQQAADVLGLDLTKDLLTRLVVDALDGSSASMAGLFQPAQKTRAGCQCSQLWPYTHANGTTAVVPGTCINPTDAPG